MYAVTARLRKVPFHRVSTKPLCTVGGDMPVTWNTEPMAELACALHADDRKPIYSRVCDCVLQAGLCWCERTGQRQVRNNKWML
jgi:hypothetical protein